MVKGKLTYGRQNGRPVVVCQQMLIVKGANNQHTKPEQSRWGSLA